MKSNKRKVIISPHCDDALLSLGGSICRWQSTEIEVITVFGTCAWAVGGDMSAAEITRLNRQEELKALQKAGSKCVLLDFDEVLLRGYEKWNSEPNMNDQNLREDVEKTLRNLVKPNSEVYVPLAVGGHTDHVICKDAAIQNIELWFENNCEVYFYEDLPYSWYDDPSLTAKKLGYKSKQIFTDITEFMSCKIYLIKIYKTQIGVEEVRKVREYARRVNGGRESERVWQVQQ